MWLWLPWEDFLWVLRQALNQDIMQTFKEDIFLKLNRKKNLKTMY